jgi:hypothetical protein
MSQANVKVVQGMVDAFTNGQATSAAAPLDPDVVCLRKMGKAVEAAGLSE